MDERLFLGVDIGGTKVAAAVARSSGEILEHVVAPTAHGSDDATVGSVVRTLEQALERAGVAMREIAAIGVGAPGCVDVANGVWYGGSNVHLSKPVPLVALVRERFGRPAFLENDVKAGALGERRYGAGRGVQSMVYLSVGTGIAAGVIIDGQLYRGVGAAGEIGHAPVERNGPLCNCGTHGCLEMMASGAAIARRGRAALQSGKATLIRHLAGARSDAVTGQLVLQAAQQGDSVALEIIEETVAYLAMGVIMAFRAYDPQLLVIGGGVAQAGQLLFAPLLEALRRETGGLRASCAERVVLTALGDRAGVLGSVALAVQKTSEPAARRRRAL